MLTATLMSSPPEVFPDRVGDQHGAGIDGRPVARFDHDPGQGLRPRIAEVDASVAAEMGPDDLRRRRDLREFGEIRLPTDPDVDARLGELDQALAERGQRPPPPGPG